jgi:hypothetical protein
MLLYPTRTVIVPAWRIRVADETGRPMPNEFVRQTWKHHSLEPDAGNHSDDRWTDASGYVSFPERTTRANLLRRMFVPLRHTVALGPHASYGASSNIMVWGGRLIPEVASYKPGEPLPDEITFPRQGNF